MSLQTGLWKDFLNDSESWVDLGSLLSFGDSSGAERERKHIGKGAGHARRGLAARDSQGTVRAGEASEVGGEDLVDVFTHVRGVGGTSDLRDGGWDGCSGDCVPAGSEGSSLEGEAARNRSGERTWLGQSWLVCVLQRDDVCQGRGDGCDVRHDWRGREE